MLRCRRFDLRVAFLLSGDETMNDSKDPRAYSVYAYVFNDGHAYVGLTIRPETRHSGHKNGADSPVYRYWKESGQKFFPDMTVLYEKLTASEAQLTEDMLANAVGPELRLNTADTGVGIGSLGVPDLSEERVGRMLARRTWKDREGLRTRFAVYGKAMQPRPCDATPELCRTAMKCLQDRAVRRARLYESILPQVRESGKWSAPDAIAWARSRMLAG